jgi:hypothetical protein
MTDENTIDEPGPTVVGPQPAKREGGRKIQVPRGLEKLVALAKLSPEWREKVLTAPLAAADESELELSESERAIIKSVPRTSLEQMIDSFGEKLPEPRKFSRMAAGAAAAALLATSLTGCNDEPKPPAPTGSRPDVPATKPADPEPAPPATKGMRADFPKPPEPKSEPVPPPTRGISPDLPKKK